MAGGYSLKVSSRSSRPPVDVAHVLRASGRIRTCTDPRACTDPDVVRVACQQRNAVSGMPSGTRLASSADTSSISLGFWGGRFWRGLIPDDEATCHDVLLLAGCGDPHQPRTDGRLSP